MKLDYLQFLELEVFTRFGTRLEASMEKAIRRGRILREIFKQEQLHPLPVELQMAWLVAYNAGLFDDIEFSDVGRVLLHLQHCVKEDPLSLEESRDRWLEKVSHWLSGIVSAGVV